MALLEIIEKAQTLQETLSNIVEQFIRDNEQFVLNLNREELDKGRTAKGKTIKPKYAASTAKIKRKKGQQVNPPNLKDTGAHRASLKIVYESDGFSIDDNYGLVGDILKKRYGMILGLNGDAKKRLKRALRTYVRKEIQRIV